MDDIYKNIEEYNIKIRNVKYWLYLMIWLLICLSTKFSTNRNRLFIKLNISLRSIIQSYFAVRKNNMHYFTVKIPNKREPQQVVFKYSSDIEFEDFMNLYKKYAA